MVRPDPLESLLVGKAEIAGLARVRRPVVTMWIARHRTSAEPFPDPVPSAAGRELYRGVEVADWIRARGLGNNPALREDLAAHAVLLAESPGDPFPRERPGPDTQDADGRRAFPRGSVDRHRALTALLALRAALGEPLTGQGADDLLAAARLVDPDDRCLAGEIAGLGTEVSTLARWVDLLCDAAYGPGPAFAALQRRSARAALDGTPGTAMSTPAGPGASAGQAAPPGVAGAASLADRITTLIGRLGSGIIGPAASARITDPDPLDATMLLAIRAALPEDAEAELLVGGGDTPGSRLARRHLLAAGVSGDGLESGGRDDGDGTGGWAAATLSVVRLPDVAGGQSPLEAVTRLDRYCRAVPAGAPAVVLGPAAVLTDRIADPATDAIRWDLLRSDRVRAVVRLPEGLVPSRPGTALALWVLGPERDLAADERWMTIADLSAVDLDDAAAGDLVTDVLASLAPYAEANRHAFRYARIVRTAGVIARGSMLPVPPPTAAPGRTVGAADAAVTVQMAADRIAAPEPEQAPDLRVTAADRPRARLVPAGRLAADRKLRILPGTRIDGAHLDAGGSVALIGPQEIHGQRAIGDRRIDRLVFTRAYPRARYTERGDVVFCTSPSPGALVDVEGGRVVVAPARILRVADPSSSGLVPQLLAARLRRLVPDRKPTGAIRSTAGWRTWLLPVLDADAVPAAGDALERLDAHRRMLAERLSAVNDLMQTLTAHLADGVVTVEAAPGERRPARR